MKKVHAIALAVVTFLLGGASSLLGAAWLMSSHLPSMMDSAWLEEIDGTLTVLEGIRSGKVQDVLEDHESSLDVLVVSLAKGPFGESQDAQRTLERIRTYRRAHPRVSSNPDFDALVNEALGRAAGTRK